MESLQGPRQNGKLKEKEILVFFCNLEKKHFTEKIISKLVVENNQVIQHPKAILRTTNYFTRNYFRE